MQKFTETQTKIMQFAVPQFTEVEDRLIGPLTLKQFLVLLGTGGMVLFFWSILGPSIIFFILSFPVAVVGIASAMGRYNGRPMFSYLMPLAAFLSSTRIMVFKREVADIGVSKSELKTVKADKQTQESLEPAESRLKKLAYLLDRKTEEEGDIITKDDQDLLTGPVTSKVSPPKLQLGKMIDRTREQIMATARKLDAGAMLHRSPAKSKNITPLAEQTPRVVEEPAQLTTQPVVKPVTKEPEYEPAATDTIDFTKIVEPPSQPAPKAQRKSAARPKKQSNTKKFNPSSFLDPNA